MDGFLIIPAGESKTKLSRAVSTVQDAVGSVHDTLQIAATTGASVAIVCRSLSTRLREQIWTQVTGCTFASQVSRVISSGGRVQILLHNRAQDDDLSPELMKLAEEPSSKESLQVYVTNETEFWKTFPHFTLVHHAKGSEYALYVEMEPGEAFGNPSYLTPDHAVSGCLFVNDEKGYKVVPDLLKQFNVLFKKARDLASSHFVRVG